MSQGCWRWRGKALESLMTPIPVTILTGFLGAGKTTLLNRLLAEPGFGDTAVIVNEFGAVDIDGALVAGVGAQAFVSSTGCLCCTVAGDVRLTLLRLADDAGQGRGPAFGRVVIETTGMADPAPVLQTFMTNDIMLANFALQGVVTVVDAATGAASFERFAEARRQVAMADLVVIAKADLATPGQIAALGIRIRAMAPHARLLVAEATHVGDVFGLADPVQAVGSPAVASWPPLAASGTPDHHHRHDVAAFGFTADQPLDAGAMAAAITALQRAFGPDLLRLKGIVAERGRDRPTVWHVVQHLVSPPRPLPGWPAGPKQTRLVVIVAGAAGGRLPALMQGLLPQLRRVDATGSA